MSGNGKHKHFGTHRRSWHIVAPSAGQSVTYLWDAVIGSPLNHPFPHGNPARSARLFPPRLKVSLAGKRFGCYSRAAFQATRNKSYIISRLLKYALVRECPILVQPVVNRFITIVLLPVRGRISTGFSTDLWIVYQNRITDIHVR